MIERNPINRTPDIQNTPVVLDILEETEIKEEKDEKEEDNQTSTK